MHKYARPIVLSMLGIITACDVYASVDEPAPVPNTAPAPAADPDVRPADPAPTIDPPHAERPPITVSTGGWFEHTFRTDVDTDGGEDGDVAVSRVGADLTLSGAFNPSWRWYLPVAYEFSHYDFNDAGGLVNVTPETEPFENGHIVSLAPSLAYIIDEHWSVRGSFLVQASFESGASFGDSLTYGGVAAARYAFSKDFALSFGLAAKTRLEDSSLFIPIIGAEWRINDKLRLGSGVGGNGGRGPGISLAYTPTDKLTLTFAGTYEFREYRLDQNDGDSSEGVFDDQRVNITLGLDWRATENISIGFRGGVSVWQEYEFKNDDGDTLHEVNGDPTGLLGVNVSVKF